MRLRKWLVFALISTFGLHVSRAYSQEGTSGSTIRLMSAPAIQSSNSMPVRQASFTAPVAEQEQSDANGPNINAPPSAVETAPVQTTLGRPRMPAGLYAKSPEAAKVSRPAVQSAPRLQTTRPGGKPFQSIAAQPTISPYLYMNAGSGTSQLTNYLAFVKPQLDQAESNRQQQIEIQQLRSQVQKMSTGEESKGSGRPSAARYMDTAQFYRGLQR
jgi:hypothetical protein